MRLSVIHALLVLCGSSALSLAISRPATAGVTPLYVRPDILSFAEDHLRKTEAHVVLLPATTAETGTPQSNVVLCVVTVQIGIYDFGMYRDHPAIVLEPRYFEVRQLGDGLEIDFNGNKP